MPNKGMRSVFFTQSRSSLSDSPSQCHPSINPRDTFTATLREGDILQAESIITKWDPDGSEYAKITPLFYDSREVRKFLKAVNDLQIAMHFFMSHDPKSYSLVQAQKLTQIAMKTLQKEFYQILAANRDRLDPESVSGQSSNQSTMSSTSDFIEHSKSVDDNEPASKDSIRDVERVSMIAMSDLQLIANSMINCGYGKECIQIYKVIRKSIVDESIYRLGFQRQSLPQIQKLDWQTLDHKINLWVEATKVAIKTLFSVERILCDQVFSSSNSIKQSCFTEISKEAAINLFEFAESISKCNKSPEKIFRILDMYETIFNLWPQIELIFSYDSTSSIRSQALNSLIRLSESVRYMISEFLQAIQNDKTKGPVPGGGIHPLTGYVMNYLTFLSDYDEILGDIIANLCPLPSQRPRRSPPPGDFSPVGEQFAWILLILLCKIDAKSEFFKDVSLSYLFLANNFDYVVKKVCNTNLRILLGEDWLVIHEDKARQYAANYVKTAWGSVISSFPDDTTSEMTLLKAKVFFKKFNSAFLEAYRIQSSWVVPDTKLRNELKISIRKKIVPKYRELYDTYRVVLAGEGDHDVCIRFAPEDLENYLSDLFYGTGGFSNSGSSSSSVSYASHSKASA